jgi:catechol 2,3-dioxygenase-like lactoylglutathione lyase family enzyme
VDMKFEVAVIPVSDTDRAKEFYGRLGLRLDADFPFDNGFRVVQADPDWPDWYAAYMVAEQAGTELPR